MKTTPSVIQHVTKTYGGAEIKLHAFLNSAPHGGKLETALDTHLVGGWLGPEASLEAMVKRKIPFPPIPRIELQSSSPLPLFMIFIAIYRDLSIREQRDLIDVQTPSSALRTLPYLAVLISRCLRPFLISYTHRKFSLEVSAFFDCLCYNRIRPYTEFC